MKVAAMPVIKIFSAANPARPPNQGGHVAAAVMAKTLAAASEPLKPHEHRKRVKAERTRPKNPNSLTLNQHVFPSRSIERFTDQGGCVSVHRLHRAEVIRIKPNNPIFCGRRAWDEGTETRYMKRIEDDFQRIVDLIVEGKTQSLSSESKVAIDRAYALWYMRARYRELETQEIQLNGIVGNELTKEQEENLEKNGYIFARKNGKLPARQLNGIQLRMRIDDYARTLATTVTRWGVITAQSGEFIVPDVPSHGIIPLTPCLALVNSASDGMIVERNVAEINRAVKETSLDYFFARDCGACPF
jgi:hypothetical protein